MFIIKVKVFKFKFSWFRVKGSGYASRVHDQGKRFMVSGLGLRVKGLM